MLWIERQRGASIRHMSVHGYTLNPKWCIMGCKRQLGVCRPIAPPWPITGAARQTPSLVGLV